MKIKNKLKNLESEWFEKSTSKYLNHVYIPQTIFKELNLKHNDAVAVELKSNNFYLDFPARVGKRITNSGNSFSFCIPYHRYKDIINDKISVKITKLKKINNYTIELNENSIFIKPEQFILTEWLNKNQVVIWQKPTGYPTSRPIITAKVLELNSDMLSYLGLYMADGNTTGYYKLFTSTKDIFNLAVKGYNNIILNPVFDLNIGYDKFNKDIRSNSTIINEIKAYLGNVIPNINSVNISINTRRQNAKKRSNSHVPFGSVYIKDNRTLSRVLHHFLINCILIKFKDTKEVLTSFFIGAALGDFYPSIRNRNQSFNWLEIATNKKEVSIWKDVCKTLGFNCKEKIREGNRVMLCIHGYFNNVILLKKGLFNEYEKRRSRMIHGLKNRVETYIFQRFLKSNNNVIRWEGDFLIKTNSFFIVNKGVDLVRNGLIEFDRKNVLLTNEGTKFIEDLVKLKILEDD